MGIQSNYTAKKPDKHGIIHFSADEHETWQILYERQIRAVEGRACDAYLEGIEALKLPSHRIPQSFELTRRLEAMTGWGVEEVAAIIPVKRFFTLLANKRFPAATFIRRPEELDYLQEPDLFHEYFGHCPLLTNPEYADFIQWYGESALKCSRQIQWKLARLFWFTIEFGLLNTRSGFKIYGGGILSSYQETLYAVESNSPLRTPLHLTTALRTPYRVDILQPIYFFIDQLSDLRKIRDCDLTKEIKKAQTLGEFAPAYAKIKPQNNDIQC